MSEAQRYWVTHCEWHSNLKDAPAGDGRDVEVVLATENQALRDEVARLRAMLLRKQVHHDPPCPLCGYNGAGFYQPSTHQCMADEAALTPQAGKGGAE